MRQIFVSVMALTVLTVFTVYADKHFGQTQKIINITAQEVQQLLKGQSDIVLLDVRTKAEYTGALGHIEGSILIPLQELSARNAELLPYKDKRIIVYCRSGNRSRLAVKILMGQGYDVVNMLGGMLTWNKL